MCSKVVPITSLYYCRICPLLFSSLCTSLLSTVLVSVNYVVTSDHRLVSLFQSVNICCVFCVGGTRYSPCSLHRCCVVSFHVVCFVLFVSFAVVWGGRQWCDLLERSWVCWAGGFLWLVGF